MADEPENLILAMLREIRAKLDEHSTRFDRIDEAVVEIAKRLDDQSEVVIHALGQPTEVKFRQSLQQKRLDDLFTKVEQLLTEKQPG